MGKLTAKQVIAYSKADPKKYSDGEGLYFCVRKQGSPYWMIRYTTAKGRREPLKARVTEVHILADREHLSGLMVNSFASLGTTCLCYAKGRNGTPCKSRLLRRFNSAFRLLFTTTKRLKHCSNAASSALN